MKATRIEAVETVAWDRWLLLKVNCEDGTVGIGEAGVHGWLRPAETMVNVCEPYLVGKDPSKVEHHIQYLQRSTREYTHHFMGYGDGKGTDISAARCRQST